MTLKRHGEGVWKQDRKWRKANKRLMSGLPLASGGVNSSRNPLRIVSVRDRKQEVLSTNSQHFLGEGCSWALIPQNFGPALHVAGKSPALQKVLMQRDKKMLACLHAMQVTSRVGVNYRQPPSPF